VDPATTADVPPAAEPTRSRAGTARVLNRILVADPGQVRLHFAVGFVVCMAAGVLAVWLFARWTDQLALTVERPNGGSVTVISHPSAMVLGGITTMVTLTSVRSTEPRPHAIGMLRVAPLMVLGAVLGIVVGHGHLLSLIALCLVAAGVVLLQQWPRLAPLGSPIIFGTYLAVFIHVRLSQLPWVVAIIAVASGVCILLQLAYFGPRPERAVRRLRATFDRAADVLLDDLLALLADAGTDRQPARAAAVRASATRLQVVALTLEIQLGSPFTGLSAEQVDRLHVDVFDREACLHSLARSAGQMVRDGAQPELLAEVAQVLRALRAGDVTWVHEWSVAGVRAARERRMRTGDLSPTPPAYGVAVAAYELSHLALRPVVTTPDAADIDSFRPTVGSVGGALVGSAALATRAQLGAGKIGPFARPVARRATRMLAATSLAVGIGYAIEPNRWHWAFFAAFAVMAAANTAAEHVRTAIERAVGTAGGVAVGVLAAHGFERQPVLSFGLLFVAMGVGFYFQRASGVLYAFALTVMLGQMYVQLHQYSDDVLVTRLVETAVGTSAAIVVALLVFRVRRSAVTRTGIAQHLDALDAVIQGSVAWCRGERSGVALRSEVRRLQDILQQLRATARPVVWWRRAGAADEIELTVVSMTTHDAATLARRSAAVTFEPAHHGELDGIAAELHGAIGDIGRWLASDGSAPPQLEPSPRIVALDLEVRRDESAATVLRLAVLRQLAMIEEHLAELLAVREARLASRN
jgi:uncharacterized membrane protein YccC